MWPNANQLAMLLLLFLLIPCHFAVGPKNFRSATSSAIQFSFKALAGQFRHEKKASPIKSAEECARVLATVLGQKPVQFGQMMRDKMLVIGEIVSKLKSRANYFSGLLTAKDGEIFSELDKKYSTFFDKLKAFVQTNPNKLGDWVEEGNKEEENGSLEFGQFRLNKWNWPSDKVFLKTPVFMLSWKGEEGEQLFEGLARLFGQLSDGAKKVLGEYWFNSDAMMGQLEGVLRKADKFARALSGEPGKFKSDLEAMKLGLDGAKDIRLAQFAGTELWWQLEEDVDELERVKKYLLHNQQIKYLIKTKEGRGKMRAKSVPIEGGVVVINEQIHDPGFFETLFAPHLEEFFTILAKGQHEGGFVFKLIMVRKHEEFLAVDVGQVLGEFKEKEMPKEVPKEMPKEVPKEMPKEVPNMGRKRTFEQMEADAAEWTELEMNPEEGKPRNPLQFESDLFSHLLGSLYAKIVERLGHLRKIINPLKRPSHLIFHAYNFCLASELYKRMEELQESYDVFHDAEEQFTSDTPMSPPKEDWLERKRSERWENIQKLYKKVEARKKLLMEQTVQELPGLLNHLGYKDLGKDKAEELGQMMQAEMALTVDNLELNWAVDCQVDDIEKCLFADSNELDVNMPDVSLFSESRGDMSKVQVFFEWIYKKLNRQIRKRTKKFQKEGNPVKAFFMRKLIEILDEFRQLMENRIGMADLLIPFWTELKLYAIRPMAGKFGQLFNKIRGLIREQATELDNSQIGLQIFELGTNKLADSLKGISPEKLAQKDFGSWLMSSAFKGMVQMVLAKYGFFQHFKKYFKMQKLPNLMKLFGNLRNKLKGKKPEKETNANVITARSGIRKSWHTKWGHKIITTLVINATYRSINVVVIHGKVAKLAISTGFFLLTIVYMSAVLWLSRHVLWSITCAVGPILHCGHYFALAFAVIAAAIWLGLVLPVL